jgi:hypothetical protein
MCRGPRVTHESAELMLTPVAGASTRYTATAICLIERRCAALVIAAERDQALAVQALIGHREIARPHKGGCSVSPSHRGKLCNIDSCSFVVRTARSETGGISSTDVRSSGLRKFFRSLHNLLLEEYLDEQIP